MVCCANTIPCYSTIVLCYGGMVDMVLFGFYLVIQYSVAQLTSSHWWSYLDMQTCARLYGAIYGHAILTQHLMLCLAIHANKMATILAIYGHMKHYPAIYIHRGPGLRMYGGAPGAYEYPALHTSQHSAPCLSPPHHSPHPAHWTNSLFMLESVHFAE